MMKKRTIISAAKNPTLRITTSIAVIIGNSHQKVFRVLMRIFAKSRPYLSSFRLVLGFSIFLLKRFRSDFFILVIFRKDFFSIVVREPQILILKVCTATSLNLYKKHR